MNKQTEKLISKLHKSRQGKLICAWLLAVLCMYYVSGTRHAIVSFAVTNYME